MNFWKIYSLVFLFAYFAFTDAADGFAGWIGIFISGFGFVALIGYAFNRPLLRPFVWRIVFWVLLIDNWWDHFQNERNSLFIELASILLVIPGFIAVFRYGHSAKHIWRNNIPVAPDVVIKEAL